MSAFLAVFAGELAQLECGPLDDELLERTRAWVLARFAGAGAVTRAGLAAAGLAAATVALVFGRAPYASLPAERRHAVTRRLAGTSLPAVAEYVKAVRALVISYVYDARHATAP